MFRLPKNHPFLQFEEIETDESVMLCVSFKNMEVDKVSLYDKFGGKTARQTIPIAAIDNFAVGKIWSSTLTKFICRLKLNYI